jgi:hypothetical protein
MLPLFFVYYGAADCLRLIPGLESPKSGLSAGVLSIAEVAVLLGIGLWVLGYRSALSLWRGKPQRTALKEWRLGSMVGIGVLAWTAGLICTWIWQSEVVERYVVTTQFNALTTIAILIARLIQPVGVGLLAYAYISTRKPTMLLLVLGVLGADFIFGLVADSKELALRSAIIVIVGKYLLDGRIPKQWLIAMALAVAMTFGIFQAYRYEVLQTGKQTRAAAAENLSENVGRALDSEMLAGGLIRSGLLGFTQRVDLKPTLELVLARVGKDVDYQRGESLLHIPYSFIPRLIWPTKPDSSMGQVFNREFQISADPDTYISTTHLAELYWNFSWPGIVVGMYLIGFFLGWINSRFALSEARSLTRFLVLVTTIYLPCMRFEGNIAMEYIVWMRSLAMVAVLHLIFATTMPRLARRAGSTRPGTPAPASIAEEPAPASAR